MGKPDSGDVTMILQRAAAGDGSAVQRLVPMVYDQLRALAGRFFSDGYGGKTLEPTAVVHEAYLKLVGASQVTWESRAHFFAVAAKAMRQILTDHARRKNALKRGGGLQRITLAGVATPADDADETVDLVALEAALADLSQLDPRQAEVVELRFLGGLSADEVAHVLGISLRTVEREWFAAKAWLRRELARD
jgi:RNA polymerase sigma-70 factor (ECF subfamily)